jgi:hypothetical protein
MFNPTDGGTGAGLNYIRVPIGASDFSSGGTSLTYFGIYDADYMSSIQFGRYLW